MVENDFKNMFLEELADIVEDIARGKQPFNRPEFRIDPALSQYMSKLNDTDREKVMDALISQQKAVLGCWGYADQGKSEFLDSIWLEIKKNKGYVPVESKLDEEVKNRKSILIKVMEERKEGFLFDRGESFRGYVGFFKDWIRGKKQIIGFDVGVIRKSISIDIGIKEPNILTSISSFFLNNKSYYFWYHNKKEFEEAAHQALNLLDLIFPHYFERAEKVLSKLSED